MEPTPTPKRVQTSVPSLGSVSWLDTPELRAWFAKWLLQSWQSFYSKSLDALPGRSFAEADDGITSALKRRARQLPLLSTADQLATVAAVAAKFGLRTDRDAVLFELGWHLKKSGHTPENRAAYQASPWCNFHAVREQIRERHGLLLSSTHYPKPSEGDLRVAFKVVLTELGSPEIGRLDSPKLAQLLSLQREVAALDKAASTLPQHSPLHAAWSDVGPALAAFAGRLDAHLNDVRKEPDALTPLHVRRQQRALFSAVRRILRLSDDPLTGPKGLAVFLVSRLREWPLLPAGMTVDLANAFTPEQRQAIVRVHLGLAPEATSKAACALWRILHVAIFREHLREPLLRLAHDARQRRKGWIHLRGALEAIFVHLNHEPSDGELFRDFERVNYPCMRQLTREQREALVPESGRDPNASVRDLTPKERLAVAARYLKPKVPITFSEGRSPSEVSYRRARAGVRKELGLG